MFANPLLSGVVETVIYSIIGVLLMGLGFLMVKIVMPFSIRKEIEDDQNVSLAIIIGAVILGISIIVASVISSPSSASSGMKQINSVPACPHAMMPAASQPVNK